MENAPAAFSIINAARYLGISRANVYRLINAGAITPVKIGHRTLVRRVDADRFLEASLNPLLKAGTAHLAAGGVTADETGPVGGRGLR